MLGSALPVMFCFVAIWYPPAEIAGGALTAWMLAALLLFYVALTAFSIPHKALGAEISRGYHDRSRVFGARALAENTGTIFAAGGLALLENAAAPRMAAAAIAVCGGFATALLICACVVRMRERPAYQHRPVTSRPFESFAAVFYNRHARLLLGVFFFEFLGHQAFVTTIPFATHYTLGTPGRTSLYLASALVTTLLTIPIWLPIARRIGKTRAWIVSLLMKVIVFAGFFYARPGAEIWIVTLTVVYGAAASCGAVMGPSIKSDVIDLEEARSGERREGVFFAAWNLVLKSAVALSMALCGWVLAFSGFVPNEVQSPSAALGIRALMGPIPLTFHLIAAGILLRLKLDASDHRRAQDGEAELETGGMTR
jgi:GPH family glycoside/pentoside/hexuronide:cation symporter